MRRENGPVPRRNARRTATVARMAPLTLSRPAAEVPVECRSRRAVGNDGLTDSEREALAQAYKETGPARAATRSELRAVSEWLRKKRAETQLA